MLEDFLSRMNDRIKESSSDEEEEKFLTKEEIEALILSLARSRGYDGFDEEEAYRVIKWAEEQRIGAALVDLVCRGFADVNLVNNEPVFSISAMGKIAFEGEKDGSGN